MQKPSSPWRVLKGNMHIGNGKEYANHQEDATWQRNIQTHTHTHIKADEDLRSMTPSIWNYLSDQNRIRR